MSRLPLSRTFILLNRGAAHKLRPVDLSPERGAMYKHGGEPASTDVSGPVLPANFNERTA